MTTRELAEIDKRVLWHPFTQQQGWCEEEPLIIERGEGCTLFDTDGNAYLDGVSSLWCNVHGHGHPAIDRAVRAQLEKVAHTTMLGLSHPGAIELAQRLVDIAPPGLSRVFYSDNGSTAAEVALKMAFQYWRHRGESGRNGFITLRDAYHGDTIGSVSVGGIDLFHACFGPLLFRDLAGRAGRRRRHGGAAAPSTPARSRRSSSSRSCRARRASSRIPTGYLARRPRAVRRARRAAHLRRGRDRLRAHRDDVRLRARGRRAGPHVRRQGADRRLPAARRDARHRAHLRGVPRRARGAADVLPRPHVHGQPARLRGGDRDARRLRARAHARRAGSRRSPCSPSCSTSSSRRCAASARSAGAASWWGSSSRASRWRRGWAIR